MFQLLFFIGRKTSIQDLFGITIGLEEINAGTGEPYSDFPEILFPVELPDDRGAKFVRDRSILQEADAFGDVGKGDCNSGCMGIACRRRFDIHGDIVREPFF